MTGRLLKVLAFYIATASAVCYAGVVPLSNVDTGYRSENNKGNYAFAYTGREGLSFHEESGSPGLKHGSYGVTEADGTARVVNYIADENGFRVASILLKDQAALRTTTAPPILSAQAQPVIVPAAFPLEVATHQSAAGSGAEKLFHRVDDADVASKPEPATEPQKEPVVVPTEDHQESPASSSGPARPSHPQAVTPAKPVPAEKHDDGSILQPVVLTQQLPTNVISPRPQDLPAAVFFVPAQNQQSSAYVRVHAYSVHGFVPAPDISGATPGVGSTERPSFETRQQIYGVRAQIPQVPPTTPLTFWHYVAVPRPQLHTYAPLLPL